MLSMNVKSPYAWKRESNKRDAGDLPSVRIMRALLSHATARGIPLRAEHLIWGASEAEIAALTAPRTPVAAE
jgi:hypothetical protein